MKTIILSHHHATGAGGISFFSPYLQTVLKGYPHPTFSYAQNNQGFTLTYLLKDLHLIH